ncbi:hypothetical protein VTK26DRAFT_576 [Humicola hyalothermophila]
MKIDAQELRRRWSDKTNAMFSPRDRFDGEHTYPAEAYEREFDFKGCNKIVFLDGEGKRRPEDVILFTQGSGHMTLPAGVEVLVYSGYAKWEPAASAGSAYSGAVTARGGSSGYWPSPPREVSRSNSYAAGPASNYMSGRGHSADPGDWEVVEEVSDFGARTGRNRDDACSIGPNDSISSVGANQYAGGYSRHYSDY